MEDPITFDIYGKIYPQKRSDAVNILINAGVYPNEMAVRKAINRSIHENTSILLARMVTWSEATVLHTHCVWAWDIAVYQAGYQPDDMLACCATHHVYYGGVWGCHVCTGFCQK